MSLLSIVQQAAALLNIPQPAAVISNTDPQIAQMYALLIEECEELLSKNDWPSLIATVNFVSTSNTPLAQMPVADFDRLTTGSAIWNTAQRRQLIGPLSPDEWQLLVVRDVASYPQYWRFFGGNINIWGASIGDPFTYEYVSNFTAASAAGTRQPSFQADNDVSLFPESLVKLGVIWRWKRAKGFDYGEEMATYERQFERLASARAGLRTVSTRRTVDLPSNYWPGTIKVP